LCKTNRKGERQLRRPNKRKSTVFGGGGKPWEMSLTVQKGKKGTSGNTQRNEKGDLLRKHCEGGGGGSKKRCPEGDFQKKTWPAGEGYQGGGGGGLLSVMPSKGHRGTCATKKKKLAKKNQLRGGEKIGEMVSN